MSTDDDDNRGRRERMVREQLERRGVRDARVVAAMRKVPREDYVPAALRRQAFDDHALEIAAGQTISQPFIVGYMLQALAIRPGDRVLEIGTGSGYNAALLGELAAEVITVERIPELAAAAAERLRRAGLDHVHVRIADGTRGWREEAPYDAIVVTAGGPDVPRSLLRQLAPNGRLVMPVGRAGEQRLVRVRRTGRESFERELLTRVRFVPLIGAEGWRGDGTD
ncbi:MAG: protein-L-isoaspartate(D-aspartate) O-methyltransferase [Planctomycetes bacterium]|nr:protein-L-isoaspartate(D-aspartate) O-methyltransferase [Planctomycetota bacterium]